MPSVLAVPIDELIVGIFAFIIVFGVLAKVALPKIKATLEARTDAIEVGSRVPRPRRPRRRSRVMNTARRSPRLARRRQRSAPRRKVTGRASSRKHARKHATRPLP